MKIWFINIINIKLVFIFWKRNAYLEAVEIFKEGKALPRWVENVVITASKIKGFTIDEDDEDDGNYIPAQEDTAGHLEYSIEVNGHSLLNGGNKHENRGPLAVYRELNVNKNIKKT